MRATILESSENGTLITVATDPTDAALRYRIDFSESEALDENGRKVKYPISKIIAINGITEDLTVNGKIDRETVSSIKLSVKVEDTASKHETPKIARISQISDFSGRDRRRKQISQNTSLRTSRSAGNPKN